MKNSEAINQKSIPFFQVDAFTRDAFAGNAAAVCMLDGWLNDATLQSIACENNLSETAFVVRRDDEYELRWFTPAVEVDLCGHATLAAACVLFTHYHYSRTEVRFLTRSGELTVKRCGDRYVLNFPLVEPVKIAPPPGLLAALGIEGATVETWQAADIVVVIDNESLLDSLSPDFLALARFVTRGVVVCAASEQFDFRSRWFGPQVGVNEDPVTGSAHTFLTPLWAQKTGKRELLAQQGGERKGEIGCRIAENDRVELCGHARLIIQGTLFL